MAPNGLHDARETATTDLKVRGAQVSPRNAVGLPPEFNRGPGATPVFCSPSVDAATSSSETQHLTSRRESRSGYCDVMASVAATFPDPKSGPLTASPRAYFVDILRLIASFQMVNGHTLDAVLGAEHRGGALWADYIWARGLVSVAFMFVAGFAFHLATLARFEKHKSDRAAVRKRFRRGLDLLILGYLLRMPWSHLAAPFDIPPGPLAYLLRCNVLQCIGITLIVLETLTILLKKPSHVVVGAGFLATFVTAIAPFTDGLEASGFGALVVPYVSHNVGSMFPVVPWSSFMLMGCVVGFLAMPEGSRTSQRRSFSRLVLLSLGLFVLHRSAVAMPLTWVEGSTHALSRPAFVLERLFAVTVFVSVLCALTFKLQRFPRFLRALSGETLFLYVFHLVVIYNLPFGVVAILGKGELGWGSALATSATMIALTAVAGTLWHRRKQRRSLRASMQSPSMVSPPSPTLREIA